MSVRSQNSRKKLKPNKMKHTQGQWRQAKSIIDVWGLPVSEVFCETQWIAQVRGDNGEQEANAQLIASAPELLASLADILSSLSHMELSYVLEKKVESARVVVTKETLK